MIFINQKIYNIYGGKGNGIFKKQLKLLNHNQKKNASVKFNQNFSYKKLGEIFSENVSGRYTNFPLIHNKISGNTPKGALLPLITYNPIITCAMRRINLAVSPKAYP